MRPPLKAISAALLGAAVLLTAGCAEYVAYDDGFELPGGQAPASLEGFTASALGHLQLRGLMSRYVGPGADGAYVLLDYDALAASDEARFTLDQYLAVLAAVDPAKLTSRAERLAYWINAYNAAVVRGVLARYKGDPTFKVTSSGTFFDDPVHTFGGQKMTLNHLEQGVLRGAWSHASIPRSGALLEQLKTWHAELWGAGGKVDPRFHAAVNCAALSCPNLLAAAPFAYDAASLEAQLQAATVAWLDSAAKGAGPAGISRLFDWYRDDFVASHGGVDAFIAAYRTGGLQGVDSGRFLDYDWTLNIKGAR